MTTSISQLPTRPDDSAGLARRSGFQPEIQGLRAVAVLLVVLFHLWPNRLSGGFVGVDVFFVISGYLITQHIFREVERTGTLSLRRFWSRRIRRLLPASLLVLAVSAGATVLFLPATMWDTTARQIAASALYVQNWVLARDAVDYMAKDNVPTLAQHYWSLSVEEQFYLMWPLLVLVIVAVIGRVARTRPGVVRAALIVGIGGVGALSLAWSVVATAREQSTAYFATPTRVWEFAVGALIGLGAVRPVHRATAHVLIGFLGLGAVVAAGVLFDGASLFPGWIALLPVLGTAAVIVAGSPGVHFGPGWWLSRRPLTFVGDISYSVYLWHWPLIVVVPYLTGVDLRTLDKVAIIAATIGLAWLSKVFVEDPMRTRPLLSAVPWRSFAFAGVGMAVVVAGTVAIATEVDRRVEASAAATEAIVAGDVFAATDGCIGPAALDKEHGCDEATGTGELIVPPEVVYQQNKDPAYRGCQQGMKDAVVETCTLGSRSDNPERVVALVGDSHATHWFSTLDEIGKRRDWKIVTYTKASCPITAALRVLPEEQTDDAARHCLTWGERVAADIAANDQISAVFTSAYSSAYEFDVPAEHRADAEVGAQLNANNADIAGFDSAWDTWTNAGKNVFVIRDVPPTQGGNVPDCLAANPDDVLACATDVDDLPDDPLVDAARTANDPNVHLIDLTDRFCDDSLCYPVVGDVIVYRDYSHLSEEYSRALAPYLAQQVDELTTEDD